jgi:hypothetical protein
MVNEEGGYVCDRHSSAVSKSGVEDMHCTRSPVKGSQSGAALQHRYTQGPGAAAVQEE